MAATYTTMLRSWMRQMPQWTKGLDRGRVYMEEQATLPRHDNNGVNVEIPSAEQSIIVYEQSWGASNYAATRRRGFLRSPGRRRTLWRPSGSVEEIHGHMKRKVRRTIRRFFMDGQTYYRGHHIVTGTQLAAFSVRLLSRQSGTQPGKHDELSSNSDVNDTAGIGRRLRETSTSFEMERLICAPHLPFQPRIR